MVYPHNGKLYKNKNEQSTATHNMDESDSNVSSENDKLKKYIRYDYNLHMQNS